jgi:hypothetical protein
MLRRVGLQRGFVVVKAHRIPQQRRGGRGVRVLGCLPEVAELVHELRVEGVLLDQQVRDAVHDSQIAVRAELQVVITEIRGACAARTDVNERHLFPARAAVNHAAEEHRMHLRHVVSPHDEHIALVEVVVAARRLVHAIHAEKARDRAGHADAGVGVDVVAGEAAFDEFVRRVALRDRPLAAAIDRKLLRRGLDASARSFR